MLKIYKASAGSGKTHILAGNYIVDSFVPKAPAIRDSSIFEAFRDTMAFARILAVTFTNKAAGEMKARILKEFDILAGAVPDKKSAYIGDIQKKYPNYSPEQIVARARDIRSAILHNYSDFNLRTIDSFVQRIVRAFCFDLDQNSGFSTQTDEAVVLDDLIDRLFRRADDDADLRNQLFEMAKNNVEEGNKWDFRDNIRSLAKLIFSEKFQDLVKEQRRLLDNIDDEQERSVFWKNYYDKSLELVNSIYKEYGNKSKELSKQAKNLFDSICKSNGASIKDLGRDLGWLYSWFTGKFLSSEISTTAQKFIDSDDWKPKSAKGAQANLINEVQTKLKPLLGQAISHIENGAKEYLTAKVIRKDFYAFMLLGDLAMLLPEYRAENKAMLVSDATAFLNAIVENNDAPFIYERVGNKFDHIFIDEFQDTSAYQWNNFRPLVENTNAQGFNNMIVGDVKQSIYRFRGGDWSLLNNVVQQQIGDEMIDIQTLDVNWRSRRNIVEFNDAIFQKSVKMLGLHGDQALDFGTLSQIYSDSFQKLPANKDHSGGKVDVVFIDTEAENADIAEAAADDEEAESLGFKQLALKRMAGEIDKLIKDGVKAKRICILVRKGREAAECIEYLMDYQNKADDAAKYDIVSAQSLYVANSLVVKAVISTMKLINNPDDMLSKAEAMRSYCDISDVNVDDGTIFRACSDPKLAETFMPAGFADICESCSDLPLYDLCEKIIGFYSLQKFTGDSEYLRTFEDCVLDFSKTFSSDLNKFVKWWDESGVATAIQPSENQNAVTVMTIHKSKGLDFDIQFVPFCNWKMEDYNSQQANYIWVRSSDPDDKVFTKFPYLPVRYSSQLLNTVFASNYIEEKRNMYVDSLNLLYVALTRPVYELHIYCQKRKPAKKKESSEIKTVGDLLYFCITEDLPDQNPDIVSLPKFYNEDESTLLMDKGHDLEISGWDDHEGISFRLSPYKNSPWDSKMNIRTESTDFFIQQSPFLQDRINHGLFMHNIMSKIEYREDIPEVLQEMVFQGRINEQQRKELSDMLDESFKNPEVERWFSHSWKEVLTERALLTTDGNIRIPDRVVVSDSETVVIDFKFGGEHDEYKQQVREYMGLLVDMHRPNVKGYLFYVESGKICEV